jgi:FixJ family two-component response regulator
MTDQMLDAKPNARRILIVEDDPAARRSLLLLLTGRGFGAVAFPTAAQALMNAAMQPPACLVADYRLEDSNGIALLEMMRARGWTGPAVLISAYSSGELSDRAKAAGFAVIFDKPLREHALVDTVGRLVEGSA